MIYCISLLTLTQLDIFIEYDVGTGTYFWQQIIFYFPFPRVLFPTVCVNLPHTHTPHFFLKLLISTRIILLILLGFFFLVVFVGFITLHTSMGQSPSVYTYLIF